MYISKLVLENFRAWENLSCELDKKLNVFVGMNGSGKSSVLDATAILLSWVVNRIKTLNAAGRPIIYADINNKQPSADIKLQMFDGAYSSWNITKTRKGYSKKDAVSVLISATEFAKKIQKSITEHNGKTNIPLFVYYPVNRAVLEIPLRIRGKHNFDIVAAYDESLISAAKFKIFFEWFRNQEDVENENRKYINERVKPNDFEFPDRQLETVRNALSIFMPDFKNWTVRRSPLRMEVEKDSQKLTVNQLSDGEKCLMALIGDLARRMAIANPLLDNPLNGEGIVLIDEIDLHLHPLWQRAMILRLLDTFPNCQFLISTHSPHVLTHVQPENIFVLRTEDGKFTCEHPRESYGKTSERILEDLMGLETTRPTKVTEALKALFVRINNGELEQAEKDIESLQQKMGDDPELVKARVLIKRKELIGK